MESYWGQCQKQCWIEVRGWKQGHPRGQGEGHSVIRGQAQDQTEVQGRNSSLQRSERSTPGVRESDIVVSNEGQVSVRSYRCQTRGQMLKYIIRVKDSFIL